MAKNMLKSYGRFELLELIYNMRKENLELRERCEKAEKQAADTRIEMDRQLDAARKDFESRIEELRMQGAAKDLQIRMKKIEEQLRVMQRLTSVDVDISEGVNTEDVKQLARDIEKHQDEEKTDDKTAETTGAEQQDAGKKAPEKKA